MAAATEPLVLQLEEDTERVWCGAVEIPLRPKAFAVLRYLMEQRGRLVSREELLRVVWGETKVSAGVVRVCLREIRQALGESGATPRFIETVPRRGWRFIGTVQRREQVGGARSRVERARSETVARSAPTVGERHAPLLSSTAAFGLVGRTAELQQ